MGFELADMLRYSPLGHTHLVSRRSEIQMTARNVEGAQGV
jgi:hypothetical protein